MAGTLVRATIGLLGLGGSLLVTRFMASLLFGVSPTDVSTLVGAALLLLAVALLATLFPAPAVAARRSRVDDESRVAATSPPSGS
jgi:hypothetical protein